jgi:hypothetical protein
MKIFETPYIFPPRATVDATFVPWLGHQSTAGACGNNFRFWKTIWHLATDDTKSLAPSTGSATRYGRAPSREERAQIDFLLKRDE